MRTTRIYHPGEYEPNDEITLSPEASHHLITVLRMSVGCLITLFNGAQRESQSTIISAHKKHTVLKILNTHLVDRESPCHIHLGQGIAKGDKMEWIVQKATELGVAEITPLFTQHGAVKQEKARFEKKWQQWQAIALNAAEQSGRTKIPLIHFPTDFEDFVHQSIAHPKYILDPYSSSKFKQILPHTLPHAILLIGPEGGFHTEEIAMAKTNHYDHVSLGPRILRTETAAITALSILQALTGDL
jgi:16S rRNA (uracil1498-N3)-methyltransferase